MRLEREYDVRGSVQCEIEKSLYMLYMTHSTGLYISWTRKFFLDLREQVEYVS
jgi:hypothetical protein